MSHTHEHEVPVLIVGAGPAGLTTAVTLARYGIRSLLVERSRGRAALPRATAISTACMELFRSWGLEDEIRAGADDVEWLGLACETLAAAGSGSTFEVGLPTRQQSSALSPTGPACVPQDHLEPVLMRHLLAQGTCRVDLGTELVGLISTGAGAGVRATLRDVATGQERVVHARYLVAADGVRSRVRTALGIARHGPGRLADRVAALFHAPLWELLDEHRYGLYSITHRDVPDAAFLPAGRGDRWVFALTWDPQQERLANYTEGRVTRLMRLASGVPELAPRIAAIAPVTFAVRLSERFRQGDAFLVGDAAHQVTPRGGTGMNTAIQDGRDLGWKLAWVLRGWAQAALLDSYEQERRPVAEHNALRSADPEGSRRDLGGELHADLGGRMPHLWLPSTAGRVSTLDLLGPGLTLFTGPEGESWASAAAARRGPLPVTVLALDPIAARAVGIRNDGALLVRPDGVPAGCWTRAVDAAPALLAA